MTEIYMTTHRKILQFGSILISDHNLKLRWKEEESPLYPSHKETNQVKISKESPHSGLAWQGTLEERMIIRHGQSQKPLSEKWILILKDLMRSGS